ncbi:Hypothetical predicted protein [Xyrichtys novacula]|uniref:Uncharacterized protein n=1 Tax=Xyrichtys novacula TaxID=13765 RepID=A0AAV1HJ11_XYRNO|nr:Hypothetical predicted protein [Xyrichtys novacula]
MQRTGGRSEDHSERLRHNPQTLMTLSAPILNGVTRHERVTPFKDESTISQPEQRVTKLKAQQLQNQTKQTRLEEAFREQKIHNAEL